MTVPYKELVQVIKDQLPSISTANVINGGVGYIVDPDFTGTKRFFKVLAGDINFMAPDATLITAMDVPRGRNALIFDRFQPDEGDILSYGDVQYLVTNWIDGITYVDPVLQSDVIETAVFRKVAVRFQVRGQLTIRSLSIQTKYPIVVGDTLQVGNLDFRVVESQVNNAGYTDVVVDKDFSLDYSDMTGYLIVNPYYQSNKIGIGKLAGPFDLVIPINTQFPNDFSVTVVVDLMSQAGVLKTYTRVATSTEPLRFPLYSVPVSCSSLACANRLEGVMDFNGSAVGLTDGCILQWKDDFPTDQVKRWMLRYESESAGKLVVRMDPNPAQVFNIKAGPGNISVKGFLEQKEKVEDIKFIFLSEGGFHPNYLQTSAKAIPTFWLRELIPETVASYVRYSILLESTELFRSDHMLFIGPRAQPSLPDVELCYSEIERLDSGWLLKR